MLTRSDLPAAGETGLRRRATFHRPAGVRETNKGLLLRGLGRRLHRRPGPETGRGPQGYRRSDDRIREDFGARRAGWPAETRNGRTTPGSFLSSCNRWRPLDEPDLRRFHGRRQHRWRRSRYSPRRGGRDRRVDAEARVARALVSDMVAYHPQKRDEGMRAGTLKQLFREEIKKSYEEYVEQIGKEFAESTSHFQDALNDVLAGGKKVF